WGLYRDPGITLPWAPWHKPAEKKDQEAPPDKRAAARPEQLPAPVSQVRDFLRRALFTIPPARLPKRADMGGETLKPLPARRAKLALVEACRDVALDSRDFAGDVAPVLREFLDSRG